MAATDGGFVKMEIGGLVLVMTALVFFPVVGDGDSIVAVGDAEKVGKLDTEILEAEFVPFVGGCRELP